MPKATLAIASKNYGSWSLRGWLLCKLAGLDFHEQQVASDDPSTRAELLLLSPSFLVPCLTDNGLKIWDTLAIAEYLHEIKPKAASAPRSEPVKIEARFEESASPTLFWSLQREYNVPKEQAQAIAAAHGQDWKTAVAKLKALIPEFQREQAKAAV